MWKTLTAKCNWLPVAYHLFQGVEKKCTQRAFGVLVSIWLGRRCSRISVDLCERNNDRDTLGTHTAAHVRR